MSKRQRELFPKFIDQKRYVSDIAQLVAEWHPEKNSNTFPEDYLAQSNKSVWWKCSKAHEWKAAIYSRTAGRNCPYCSGKRPSETHNLQSNFPHIAAEWHQNNPASPKEFTPFSNKKAFWQCERGHEWSTTIAHRTILGNGCPKCSNQSSKNEIRILTELQGMFDDVISRHKISGHEVDVFIPSLGAAIEYDGKYWHQGKEAKDLEKNRAIEANGLTLLRVREAPLKPISKKDLIIPCGSLITKDQMNRLVVKISDEFNATYAKETQFLNDELYRTYLDYFPSPFPEKSLKIINPTLAQEWHPKKNSPLTPTNFSPNARQKVWWQCANGHEWEAAIYSRNSGGHKCPFCMGRNATPETSLAATHPAVARLWHPSKNGHATPLNTKAGSGIKRWWQCLNDSNHLWELSPDKMTAPRKSEHCPHCRSLGVKYPELMPLWHSQKNGEVTPFDVLSGSGKKYWWQCTINPEHQWQSSPNAITKPNRKLGYCPYCSSRKR